jgi:flagellar basal-body rod protein FlgB
MELLAANLANADTPHYKARDVDFKSALEEATAGQALTATHAAHLSASGSPAMVEAKYRIPNQPALDGNTVDPAAEQSAFAETALQYQTSLTLLGMRIAGLRSAIRGE